MVDMIFHNIYELLMSIPRILKQPIVIGYNHLLNYLQTLINNSLSLLANHVNRNMSRAVTLNLIKHS